MWTAILIIWLAIGFFSFVGYLVQQLKYPWVTIELNIILKFLLAVICGPISFFIYFGDTTIYRKR